MHACMHACIHSLIHSRHSVKHEYVVQMITTTAYENIGTVNMLYNELYRVYKI